MSLDQVRAWPDLTALIGFNDHVGWLGRILGFGLGFGISIVGILALHAMYRGAWIPLGLVVVVAILFSWHPRLKVAPASGWFVAVFGILILAAWMKSTGPTPIKGFRRISEAVPIILLLTTLPLVVVMVRRNLAAAPRFVLYLPVACLILLIGLSIVYFSGGKGGADPMIRFLIDRFGVDVNTAEATVVVLRKSIHFLVYGLLGWAAFRLANPRFDLRSAVLFGFLIAGTFALFDEFRQSLATNRSASLWDIGLDLLGCLTFIGISVIRYRRKPQPISVAERLLG